MADNASIDQNYTRSLLGVSSVDGVSTVKVYADPTTHRLLVDVSGIAGLFQTDVFTATNQQTAFTASKTVGATIGFFIGPAFQVPTTDYTVAAGVATLTNASYPNGVPLNTPVVWVYVTS